MPQYVHMALALHVSRSLSLPIAVSLGTPTYHSVTIYVSLGALNAGHVDDSIPAYGTGLYTSLSLSLYM
jgi:hypothetical protein